MIQRSGPAMSDADRIQEMLKRQRMLSDFGAFALTCQNLDEGLSKACSLVADVLGTGRAKVLEIPHAGECLFVRAGVGWRPASSASSVARPLSRRASEAAVLVSARTGRLPSAHAGHSDGSDAPVRGDCRLGSATRMRLGSMT
jgi:hypothetical protein